MAKHNAVCILELMILLELLVSMVMMDVLVNSGTFSTEIFQAFWKMGSRDAKTNYIIACIWHLPQFPISALY